MFGRDANNDGRNIGAGLLILAALALAGCSTPPIRTLETATPKPTVQPAEAPVSSPRASEPKAEAETEAKAAPSPEPQVAATPKPSPTALRTARGDIGRLVGQRAAAIQAALGEPSFIRRERPAQIWQYRDAECVLDVFLYGEGDEAVVAHIDLRGRLRTDQVPAACAERLLSGSAERPGTPEKKGR